MEASVLEGVYLHYSDKLSKPESEESIAKRIQSTKQRLNEITKKEKKITHLLKCSKDILVIRIQAIYTRL